MVNIQCELCGGNKLMKTEGMFICLNCGTKYSLEDARRLVHNEGNNVSKQSLNSSADYNNFYFESDIGLLIKDKLIISPDGITWKNHHYPLESITRIRFGSTLHSVIVAFNVFEVCTTYTVYFGTENKLIKIGAKKEQFVSLVDNLWKAVAGNIIRAMLNRLARGEAIPLGNCDFSRIFQVKNTGIEFYSDWSKKVYSYVPPLLEWAELNKIWKFGSVRGSLLIYLNKNNKWQDVVCCDYLEDDNTPIYEHIFRIAEKYKPKQLSDLLNSNGLL